MVVDMVLVVVVVMMIVDEIVIVVVVMIVKVLLMAVLALKRHKKYRRVYTMKVNLRVIGELPHLVIYNLQVVNLCVVKQ